MLLKSAKSTLYKQLDEYVTNKSIQDYAPVVCSLQPATGENFGEFGWVLRRNPGNRLLSLSHTPPRGRGVSPKSHGDKDLEPRISRRFSPMSESQVTEGVCTINLFLELP